MANFFTNSAVSLSNGYDARKPGFGRITNSGATLRNSILQGDCTRLMTRLDTGSVGFILTDPPYITRYRGRDGRTVANDDNARWLKPAFAELYRVLRPGGFALSF